MTTMMKMKLFVKNKLVTSILGPDYLDFVRMDGQTVTVLRYSDSDSETELTPIFRRNKMSYEITENYDYEIVSYGPRRPERNIVRPN